MRIAGITSKRFTFECDVCHRIYCRGMWVAKNCEAFEREKNGYEITFITKRCPECKFREGEGV